MKQNSKIKVSIITGFLGAGKSSFINNILKTNRTTQFALVENEFGAISIDSKLIKGVDASQMFELKQGCICCTISDEYELVLLELAERFPHVEHLLIETTGIAEPAGVLQPFYQNNEIKQHYNFIQTICIVDAVNFENSPEPEITFKQRIAADQIILNKTENLTNTDIENLKKQINRIHPFVDIHVAKFANSPSFILHKSNYIRQNQNLQLVRSVKQNYIQQKTLFINKKINRQEFEHWLSYSLDVYKNNIYRTKGILKFENELYEYILQGIGNHYEIIEGENLITSTETFIVFIGVNLPELIF